MANRSYLAENRELAYCLWRDNGQKAEPTLKALRRHPKGFPLSKPTLGAWRDTYDWVARATRAEVEERKAGDAALSFEASVISDLMEQKRQVQDRIKALGPSSIDPQLTYAYNSIVKTIIDVRVRTALQKAGFFLDFMRDLIGWFSKNDTEGVTVIERNFDDLASWAKERYAG